MKLPINPLLYLVSLAAVGGIGNSIFEQIGVSKIDSVEENKKIAEDCAEFLSDAGNLQPENAGERYSDRPAWELFRYANFTGKVEVIATDDPDLTKPEELPKDEVDLSIVIQLVCITVAGDASGVVLDYLQSVEVPEDQELAPRTAERNIPRGRRGQSNIPVAPVSAPSLSPSHHVKVGEPLWPKYDYVYLKSVSADASAVTFELRIEDKKNQAGEYPSQEIRKSQLLVPGNLLGRIRGGDSSSGGTGTGLTRTVSQPPEEQWEDPGPRTVVRDNQVTFSREDHAFLQSSGAEIFNEDVSMRDYSGGTGENKISGVQIRKISSRVSDFGLQAGDVVISLNGQPVEGMVSAKQLGRKLYNEGVRTYRAEILRRGQRTFVMYKFPPK